MSWMLILVVVNFVKYIHVNLDGRSNGHNAEKEPQYGSGHGNAGKTAGKILLHTL